MAEYWKAYHLNKMVQDAMRNGELMERLLTDPTPVFHEYGLTEEEQTVFRNPSSVALTQLGVHPILAMVFMVPRDERLRRQLTIDAAFLNKIKEWR